MASHQALFSLHGAKDTGVISLQKTILRNHFSKAYDVSL